MPQAATRRIHPTAIIDPRAELAEDVQVGPYTVIDGPVRIGPGCVIGPRAHLIGPLTLGAGNVLHANVILGDAPQHLQDAGVDAQTIIGAGNVFRENVTVHRGTARSGATIVGDRNYFMVGSHIAHDCRVGSDCLLANGALLGGHVELGDRVLISGNAAVHQFCRVGRLAMVSGVTALTTDLPPFLTVADRNCVVGVNIVGLRRAGFDTRQLSALRKAFRILFHAHVPTPVALAKIAAEVGTDAPMDEFIEFVRTSKRGLPSGRHRQLDEREAA